MVENSVQATSLLKPNIITVERTFAAKREAVWNAWRDPELVARWWGGTDQGAVLVKIDFRVGGKLLYCMRLENGYEFWGTGTYLDIDEPNRFTMTDQFADKDGNPVAGSVYGMEDDFPFEMIIRVAFFELPSGSTQIKLVHEGMPVGENTEGALKWWNQSFDKLARLL